MEEKLFWVHPWAWSHNSVTRSFWFEEIARELERVNNLLNSILDSCWNILTMLAKWSVLNTENCFVYFLVIVLHFLILICHVCLFVSYKRLNGSCPNFVWDLTWIWIMNYQNFKDLCLKVFYFCKFRKCGKKYFEIRKLLYMLTE